MMRTLEVVPSPVMSSWAVATLAISDAVGCWICCQKSFTKFLLQGKTIFTNKISIISIKSTLFWSKSCNINNSFMEHVLLGRCMCSNNSLQDSSIFHHDHSIGDANILQVPRDNRQPRVSWCPWRSFPMWWHRHARACLVLLAGSDLAKWPKRPKSLFLTIEVRGNWLVLCQTSSLVTKFVTLNGILIMKPNKSRKVNLTEPVHKDL